MAENTRRGSLHEVLRAKRLGMTRCKRGHEYTPENTRIDGRGDRNCRACAAVASREWKIANRARVNANQQRRRMEGRK